MGAMTARPASDARTPRGYCNRGRGIRFAPSPSAKIAPAPKRREKVKNDPKLVAAARELRDRYLEHVNAGALLSAAVQGKYDVGCAKALQSPARHAILLPDRAAA